MELSWVDWGLYRFDDMDENDGISGTGEARACSVGILDVALACFLPPVPPVGSPPGAEVKVVEDDAALGGALRFDFVKRLVIFGSDLCLVVRFVAGEGVTELGPDPEDGAPEVEAPSDADEDEVEASPPAEEDPGGKVVADWKYFERWSSET